MDLAVVAINERAEDDGEIVPAIFTKEELPYGQGFSVTVGAARQRLRDAESLAVLAAFPIYVAAFDRLLWGVIQLLRRIGIDTVDPSAAETGLSFKMKHLATNGGVVMEPTSRALWNLIVGVRNSIVHRGASQSHVFDAWQKCGKTDAQSIWTHLAERPLPVRNTDERLRFGDREVVGLQRALDTIAIDLAEKMRERVSLVDWARLVAAEEGPKQPWVLKDPAQNVRKLKGWARGGWGLEIDEAAALQALANPL
jgi:hypothetical protein